MSQLPKSLSKFLWHFSKKHTLPLLGMLSVSVFWAIQVSLSSYILKLIVDGVSEAAKESKSILHTVSIPAISYVVVIGFLGLLYRLHDWSSLVAFPTIKNEITSSMFRYITGHSYSYFQNTFPGSIASKINDMTKGATSILSYIFDQLIARALSFVIGLFTLYFVSPYFAGILLVWGASFLLLSYKSAKKSKPLAEEYAESRSTSVGKIVDTLNNMLSVKSFAQENYESAILDESLSDFSSKFQILQRYLLKAKAYQSIAITILISVIMYCLLYLSEKGHITAGDFALVLSLTLALTDEIYSLARQIVNFTEEVGVCSKALSLIKPPQEILDSKNAPELQITQGKITFENVNFSYKKELSLFTNKSLIIHPGEKVGLVGFSGSGKSTFINLLLRFYDVDSGRIRIDDQDIKGVTQESLRRQIALIPQETSLFHRSLMENIRYGRVDANDDDVIEASKKAHCHEFIQKLKEGYHSLVGEKGIKLSGGQRQRIAIARAILKNAPILILDEATSALDSITENYIQKSLYHLMEGRTTIVIAHRLSTLFHMDRILVFQEGKIIEEGSHEQLLSYNQHYAKLWQMQSKITADFLP